jgi:hypothetical protein
MLNNEWLLYPKPGGGSITSIVFLVQLKKDSEISSWGLNINLASGYK